MIFDRLLTNVVYEKGMGTTGIAGALAPLVKSTTLTGQFMKRTRSETKAGVETRRAPGDKVKTQQRVGKTLDTYACVDHALKENIPVEILYGAAEADLLEERKATAKRILWNIWNEWEEYVHNMLWAANKTDFQAIYGAAHVKDPSVKWNASSAVNMKLDVLTARDVGYKATGYAPNTMLIPNEVFNVIVTSDNELRDAIKYTQGGPVTLEKLAAYFEVPRVIVPQYLTDDGGIGSEKKDFLWKGDHIGLFYVDDSGSKNKDTLASTFYWEGGGQKFLGTKTGWDPDTKSEAVEVSAYLDVKKVDLSCGVIIADVLT